MKKIQVLILARKILKNNTRIFKQAKSLVDAGYEVTVIGIRPKDLSSEEIRDGYKIIRLSLDPLHNKILRSIRNLQRMTEIILVLFFKNIEKFFSFNILEFVKSKIIFDKFLKKKLTIRRNIKVEYSKSNKFSWYIAFHNKICNVLKFVYKKSRFAKINNLLCKLRVRNLLVKFNYKLLKYFKKFNKFFVNLYKIIKHIFIKGFKISNLVILLSLKKINFYIYLLIKKFLLSFRWIFISIDYYYRVYRYVTANLPVPHIIHANDLDTLFIAFILARRFKAKLIYDAQELYTGLHTLPSWYRKILFIQEYFLIRKADKITVVNDAIAEVMEKYYKRKIDAIILNCPPYEDNLHFQRGKTIREFFSIPDNVPIFLYSGGLVKQRGIENTILSLKYIKEGVLVLLGEGPLKEKLLELIAKEKLEERIFFADFIPHTEVPKFISSADVGIIPYENVGINHYLCSPSKLFHYIMAELPIACSNFPFLRKIVIGHEIGKTFDPSNPRSIAEAISLIMVSSNYKKFKENLRKIKTKYCWENEEQKFLKVYKELLRWRM